MTDLREATYRVGEYDIHLKDAGPHETGEGPVVVFLHGSGPGASGASNFRQNWPDFVAAGYRVILPDMIGYGASSKPEGIDYTLQLFTDTVYEALRQHGIARASLIGNSLGGGVAIQMALDHPEFIDKLILMAPGCVEEQAEYFKMPGIAKMVSSFGSPDFSIEEQKRLVSNLVHPDFAAKIPDALVAERYAVAKTQPKDVLMRMRTPNLGPRVGEIHKPIFVLWGINDEFCPASGSHYFESQCANARCMTFTRTGHWVQVERAIEFNRYSIDFLHEQT